MMAIRKISTTAICPGRIFRVRPEILLTPLRFTSVLTIIIRTEQPVRVRFRRLASGKYGSSAPVTGFLIVIGAMAVNSGRGRSYWKEQFEINELLMI